jgi:hypothetical protein
MLRHIKRLTEGANAFDAGAMRPAEPAANADLTRYRLLAEQLAARRKAQSDREAGPPSSHSTARPNQAPASRTALPPEASKPLAPLADKPQTKAKSAALPAPPAVAQTGHGTLRIALIAASLAVVTCWGWLYRSDIGNQVPAASDPETHTGEVLVVTKAPHPEGDQRQLEQLESALIDKAAQDQALADLRQALQRAEALSAMYAGLLALERARNDLLDEQLAAHLEDRAPTLSDTSGSSEASVSEPPALNPTPAIDKPVTPVRDEPVTVAATKPQEPLGTPEKPAEQLGAAGLSRLMSRASLLREQGDIGAARIVLERAAETGHGPALFALAESYDPAVLSAWGTFGTKGDVTKARELYARALAGGIQGARDRLESLRQ